MVTKIKTGKYDDLRAVNNQAYTFLLINAVKELQNKMIYYRQIPKNRKRKLINKRVHLIIKKLPSKQG